jgi:hypothetical protein
MLLWQGHEHEIMSKLWHVIINNLDFMLLGIIGDEQMKILT